MISSVTLRHDYDESRLDRSPAAGQELIEEASQGFGRVHALSIGQAAQCRAMLDRERHGVRYVDL